jgi:hypothetical protein
MKGGSAWQSVADAQVPTHITPQEEARGFVVDIQGSDTHPS